MGLTPVEAAAAKAGVETTKEIAKGISDVLRIPANELGLYLADKIRFLRYKSLLKILQKAEKISEQKGVKLETPSLKFLIPFAESASLEDEDADDLQEMWANLLASGGDVEIGDKLLFVNFLKNIGPREAAFLIEMIEGGRAETFALFISFHNAADAQFLDQNSFELLLERLPDDFDYEMLADLVVDVAECSGVLFSEIAFIGHVGGETDQISADIDWEKRTKREPAAAILESLGIIQKFEYKRIPAPLYPEFAELFVIGYRITSAGIAFYEACTGRKYQQEFGEKISGDYPEAFSRWLAER